MKSEKKHRLFIVPIDGSDISLKSLEYLIFLLGEKPELCINLLYIRPTLPPLFIDDSLFKQKSMIKLQEIDVKNIHMGNEILSKAKELLISKGFAEEQVKTIQLKKEVGIARDICSYANYKSEADSIVISTSGRSKLEKFFMGEIASKVLEYSRNLPVWLVNGNVKHNKILIGIDKSENCLRAVEHAGLMLQNTGVKVVLFHSKRNLRKFIPKDVLEAAPDLEELWKNQAGQEIAPYIKNAKKILLESGFLEADISTKVIDGSRSAASDILKEARTNECGTIIVGRRGATGSKELSIGSVVRKIIQDSKELSVWMIN